MAIRTLSTRRLLLRPPEAGNARAVFDAFSSDPEVTRFLKWRPHRSLADAERAMVGRLERLASGEELSWLLWLASRASVVGIISAWPTGSEVEIGFALARPYWGRGLMTEAVEAVVAWCFESEGVTCVRATCDAENRASARVLEKAGLRRDGRLPAHAIHPNVAAEPRDCLHFSRSR